MNRRWNRGFTLIEVLIATLLLSLAIFSILELKRFSHQTTTNAYLGFMASQLAREPIEVFRGLGYRWLADYDRHPLPEYPVHRAHDIAGLPDADQYPTQALDFERYIGLTQEEATLPSGKKMKALRISVTVSPRKRSWAETWFSREDVKLEALVVEQPW